MNRKRELLDVVLADGPPRRLAGRLHGGKKKPNQHANDGDHHEKLNESEGFFVDVGKNHNLSPIDPLRIPSLSPHEHTIIDCHFSIPGGLSGVYLMSPE
jgi:hypothetical protein